MATMVPHRLENGINMLKNMGFNVVFGKNALNCREYMAGTPKERADDINSFFSDKSIKAIICTIGGFHSNQVLRYLDFNLIKNNPKIFVGYSDISVLHFALYTKSNLMTFYGPAILTQSAENPSILDYTCQYFQKAVMSLEPIGKVEPSTYWTDEILNWFEKKDLERPRKLLQNEGWNWIKPGKANGEIIGGCLTSILHLRGTEFWPDFNDKIFFWEIPESAADFTKGEPVSRVDAHLTDLRLSGVFDKIKGMVVGRPFGYMPEQVEQLKIVISESTKDYYFPILYNFNIGHADPIVTIPLGVKVELDSEANKFLFLESGVVKE